MCQRFRIWQIEKWAYLPIFIYQEFIIKMYLKSEALNVKDNSKYGTPYSFVGASWNQEVLFIFIM